MISEQFPTNLNERERKSPQASTKTFQLILDGWSEYHIYDKLVDHFNIIMHGIIRRSENESTVDENR